ncbi:protein kinase domain-containing protein [Nocardiopsis mwathae]|uniref:protein kinase domain-containing protein n=1 Tax=Nocardiopsis mwathae TaxID=1472723 RepID=UPI00160C7609
MKARGARRLGRLLPDDPSEVGGYRLVGRVGSGGMGTVYAGTAAGVRGYLAVKVVHPRHAADPRFREQFAHEARLLARVNSPCVARFISADVEADHPWLATEYVPGPTVRHHVERYGPLRPGMVRALAVGVADALRAIHAAGIVHRDLKPSNVVMAPSGPKVLDFGIARPSTAADATRWVRIRRMRRALRALRLPSPATLPGPEAGSGVPRDRVGTPGWISPEQYRRRQVTDRSDVFLWGALVAFAAAAHDPFGHGHPRELARRVLHEDPDLDRLPPGLDELVPRAMAKDPGDRPDAAELLRLLLASEGAANGRSDVTPTVRRVLREQWTDVAVRFPQPPRERWWPLR